MAKQKKLFEIFSRIKGTGNELKDLKNQISNVLLNDKEYSDALEDFMEAKETLAKIKGKLILKNFSGDELHKIDTLKAGAENDKILLSDAALAKYLKGEEVILEDNDGNRYEPAFSVTFKKVK